MRFTAHRDRRGAAGRGARALLVAGRARVLRQPLRGRRDPPAVPRLRRASASTAWASARTAGSTTRASRSTSCSATPRSSSRSCCRSRGYGLLWNNPAVGRVEFADNATRWTASQARGDRLLGDRRSRPAQILAPLRRRHRPRAASCPSGRAGSGSASCATAPRRSCWRSRASTSGAGCRCRSSSPTSSTGRAMGDCRFDPAEWPDPRGDGRASSTSMGVELMVSIWPTVSPLSENYAELRDGGCSSAPTRASSSTPTIRDKGMARADAGRLLRPDQPADARVRLGRWSSATTTTSASASSGWTPASPRSSPAHPANLAFHAGPGRRGGRHLPARQRAHVRRGHAPRPARGRRDRAAVPLRLGRAAAVRRRRLVGRHPRHLGLAAPAGRGRA